MNIDLCNVRKINVPLSRNSRTKRIRRVAAIITTTIERYVKVTWRPTPQHDASSKGACEVEGEG